MSGTQPDTVLVDRQDDVLTVRLHRPGRGNALVPEMLDALLDEIDKAERLDLAALVITGHGKAFSSGGDVAEFARRIDDPAALQAWSERLVGMLNTTILRLRALPCPVLAAVNGPVTGGSVGLMLAADTILMSRDAFIQPCYAMMGFAPDGGWTALMPDRIGRARTQAWLARDHRVAADEARSIGLADRLVDAADFQTAIDEDTARLTAGSRASLANARRLLDAQCVPPLEERLAGELDAFLQQITQPETHDRMRRFLDGQSNRRSGRQTNRQGAA